MGIGNRFSGLSAETTEQYNELLSAVVKTEGAPDRPMFSPAGTPDDLFVRLAGSCFPTPISNEIGYCLFLDGGFDNFIKVKFLSEPMEDNDFQCDVEYQHPNGLSELGVLSPVFDDIIFKRSFSSVNTLAAFERRFMVQVQHHGHGEVPLAPNNSIRRRQLRQHPVLLPDVALNFVNFCAGMSISPHFSANQIIRCVWIYSFYVLL